MDALSTSTSIPFLAAWEFARVDAGRFSHPSELAQLHVQDWSAAQVPGTVASALRELGRFTFSAGDFDDSDYWFRCECHFPAAAQALHFDGLATLAEVFWNDILLLSSNNMFTQHRIDIAALEKKGVLSIRFCALNAALKQRKPRARWRTRLVAQQQIRWWRTSLLGRMPGWSPPVAAVGPYRPIRLEIQAPVVLRETDIRSRVEDGNGVVEVHLQMTVLASVSIGSVHLFVGDSRTPLMLTSDNAHHCIARGKLVLPQPALWWPHTHGEPHVYAAHLEILEAGNILRIDLGNIGFRTLQLDQSDGGFSISINGVAVFCRGACWTPLDVISLAGEESDLRATLQLARDAGMNMLRVVGTMLYESDAFYRLCDALGILVWQDFMFANMDYPVDDADFAATIQMEAAQFLRRIQRSPCIAVLCGNSEVEQQAAMLGVPRALWRNAFFDSTLPQLCSEIRPDAIYWPSSPAGGVMPFQVDTGVAHYFGVGAYLRPLDDARRAGVRFTSECLGFSHLPDASGMADLAPGDNAADSLWKQRIPHDNGAEWDFEDVRDHYLAQLYRVDPQALRQTDLPRYLALARVSTGEVMAQTLHEWRRGTSSCKGALIWLLRDLWPGAGWGLIDAAGKPKAAYYYVRRAMAALTVFIIDEGLNGLALHIVNDRPKPFSGTLSLQLFRKGETRIANGSSAIQVAAHSTIAIRADSLLEHFLDTSYAYRFGPPGHDVAIAEIRADDANETGAQAFHFPLGLRPTAQADLGLTAFCELQADGSYLLCLRSRKLAISVALNIAGYLPDDNYFHLAPGVEKFVRLQALADMPSTPPQGTAWALNAASAITIGTS